MHKKSLFYRFFSSGTFSYALAWRLRPPLCFGDYTTPLPFSCFFLDLGLFRVFPPRDVPRIPDVFDVLLMQSLTVTRPSRSFFLQPSLAFRALHFLTIGLSPHREFPASCSRLIKAEPEIEKFLEHLLAYKALPDA